jgi:hypothetical protein
VAGLAKEGFIATGVVISVVIDLSRLAVYWRQILAAKLSDSVSLLIAATLSAFLGAFLGNRLLQKITLRLIETIVSIMLLLIAVALAGGLSSRPTTRL